MSTKTKTKTKNRGGRKPGTWIAGLDGKKISAWRAETHTSRNRLASHLGVSSTSIQNWETGMAVPVRQTQLRITEIVKSIPTTEAALRVLGKGNGKGKTNGNGNGHESGHEPFGSIEVAVVDGTAQIVASLLASTKVPAEEIPQIITSVRKALSN